MQHWKATLKVSSEPFMLSGTVVLKENHIQLITDQLGDIPSNDSANFGLYFFDTRHLSTFEMRVNGHRPLYLSHTTDRNYIATFQFVNPVMHLRDRTEVPRQTISIRRTRFVDDRSFYERLGFFNCNQFPVDVDVTLSFDADFRDMFAVRGYVLQRLAGEQHTKFGDDEIVFSYVGRDRVQRNTVIRIDCPTEPLSANTVLLRLRLEPHKPTSVTLFVQPSTGRVRPRRLLNFDADLDRLAESYKTWDRISTRFETDNEYFDGSLLRQSRLDLRSLLEFPEDVRSRKTGPRSPQTFDEIVPTAGIPWYAVPFGRDAIITALQTLVYNPSIAAGTLCFLARHQGKDVNPLTEEEPGKVLHEIRRGELANLREIPHLPYYGTVDATPLFVILFAETIAWTGSEELYRDLLPHALQALEWCDQFGDIDGDGFVEYQPRSGGGVRNHGWKDSADSLQYENGRGVVMPAALVEVQGYVYKAKTALSRLLAGRGDKGLAERLRSEAQLLRERFNRDFWLDGEEFFAQALDGEKSPVPAITSNAGHCLWSEIIDAPKAEKLVGRLMRADMFSGWGIRTLSSSSSNYNPMSYHNGSVWPHDNSMIAQGMLRYGYAAESAQVISAIIEAGLRFPSNRLPELFCGFSRDRRFSSSPMAYIKSCSPQAWAAAAPFLFLQTLLDIRPSGKESAIEINPTRTNLFHRFTVEHLRIGSKTVTFRVRQGPGHAEIEILDGDAVLHSTSALVT